MAFFAADADNFEAIISRRGIVLVDCWAHWCGSCWEFRSKFERTALRHPRHIFASLDSEANRDLVRVLGVEKLPTLLVFRDGILLFQQAGNFEENELESIIDQAEQLDMDWVRAEIAAENNDHQNDKRHVN